MNTRGKPLAAAAALALLLFVLLPASLYLDNLAEFMTPPGALAGLLLAPALLFIVIVMVGLRLSGGQDFSRFSTAIAALTLLVWIQAYLLVWDYGLLDGSPIDWSTPWWRGWVDLPLWVAGLAAAAAFHRRLEKPLTTAAFTVVALQVAALTFNVMQHWNLLAIKPSQHAAANDLEAMARFSAQRNALHLVLDSFQADVFKDIVSGPDGASLQAALPGFTFFEENLGTFPATHLALPALVSGQAYLNHMPRSEFMQSVFGGKTVLNAAHDAGFEVDIASDPMMLDLLMKGHFDNAYLAHRAPLVEDAARVLDLALFRVAPHWLKPHVYNDQRWRLQGLITTTDLLHYRYFTHNAFLADITRRLATDRQAPVYKFFHLMTTHAPFVVNPDCSPVGHVVDRTRETVTAQSRCSLDFVIALLDRMKQAGIYDRALIVIMGDHGGHIAPHRYREGDIVDGSMAYRLPPDYVALATPLLAIKPPGSEHPFRFSSAFTSTSDVAATIDSLLELGSGMPGRSILDAGRNPAEARTFYLYDWSRMDPVSEYVGTIREHTVAGTAYEVGSWRMGPTFQPPEARR